MKTKKGKGKRGNMKKKNELKRKERKRKESEDEQNGRRWKKNNAIHTEYEDGGKQT